MNFPRISSNIVRHEFCHIPNEGGNIDIFKEMDRCGCWCIFRVRRHCICRRSDTPSKLGDMGKFEGEVITIAGSMQGKERKTCLQP